MRKFKALSKDQLHKIAKDKGHRICNRFGHVYFTSENIEYRIQIKTRIYKVQRKIKLGDRNGWHTIGTAKLLKGK